MHCQLLDPVKRRLCTAISLAIMMNLVPQAFAADTGDAAADPAKKATQLATVTVQAEKRDNADLQKTAISVSTVSAETLKQNNINNVVDLNGQVPGLVVSKSGGGENLITIRGIGSQTPENTSTQPGVSYHLDGVYIFNSIATNAAFVDTDHLEILRGPQGTVFGQSSTGGTINVSSVQPELGQTSGDVSVGAGNHGLIKSSASLNLPAGETFAIRVHAQQYRHDGYSNVYGIPGVNKYPEDQADDKAGKITALWKPTDNFSWQLSATTFRTNTNAPAQKNILDPLSGARSLSQDFAGKSKIDTDLFTSVMRWDLGWGVFKSISGYQKLKSDLSWDSDGLTSDVFQKVSYGAKDYDHTALWATNAHAYSQEFNLASSGDSRLQWITGLVYMHSVNNQYIVEFAGDDGNLVSPIPAKSTTVSPDNLTFGQIAHTTRKALAAYAQGELQVTDKGKLTAGVRYNHDQYSGTSREYYGETTKLDSSTTNEVTGKLAYDYQFTPQSMGYLSFTRGYKPGGVNSTTGLLVKGSYKPETVNSIELGIKNRFLDNSLQFNASAFHYDYKNMQFLNEDPLLYYKGISNAPSASIYGAEFELTWLISRDWRLDSNLALEKGKFNKTYYALDPVAANAAQVAAGYPTKALFYENYYAAYTARAAAESNINHNDVPEMPHVQGSVSLSNMHDFSLGTLTSRLEFVHRGHYQSRVFNNPAYDGVPSYNLFNLYFDFTPVESPWDVSLSVTNLTDKTIVNSRYTDPYGSFQTFETYMPPRQFIFSVSYNF